MSDTDALWDTSPRAMAARFGDVALERLRTGRDLGGVVRTAFSYAALALDEDARLGRSVLEFVRRDGPRDTCRPNS